VSSSSPRGLVLRIALGGRDGLVGRAARAGAAAASMAGDTGARSGAGFEGKSRNLEGILKRQAAAPELTLLFLDGVGAHSEVRAEERGAQCEAGMGRTASAVLRVKHEGVGERTRWLSGVAGSFGHGHGW
jgi:hypothetical protein